MNLPLFVEMRPTKTAARLSFACVAFALSGIAALSNVGCYSPNARGRWTNTTAPTAATTTGWFHQQLGGASFVEIPKQPRSEQRTSRLDNGSRLTTINATATIGEMSFITVSHEFESGVGGSPMDVLDELFDSFVGDADGLEIIAADAAWRNGYPGSVIEVRNRDATRRIVVHQYVGRNHAYLFGFGVPAGSVSNYASYERYFFESISLDAADAPSPAGTGRLDFGQWAWVYPPEAEFAAELPGSARREDSTFVYGNETYDTYTYIVRGDDGISKMSVRMIPIDEDERHDDILQQMATDAARGGTLRLVRPAMRTGYGGQALVVDTPTSTRYVLHIVRTDGVYEIIHEMPSANEQTMAEARRRFFGSFMFP